MRQSHLSAAAGKTVCARPARKAAVVLRAFALLVVISIATTALLQAQKAGRAPVGEAFVYKTVDSRSLHLYVLKPDGTAHSHPAIIFFHGGGWIAGGPAAFDPQARDLAQRGMVAIEVEYRLLNREKAPGTPVQSPKICVEDAKSAVRWVRAHAKQLEVDPNKIVEAGGSAGGYLAAFASMVPGWDDPQDDMAISAKANLLILFNPVIDNSRTGFGYARLGEDYKRYSPIFFVNHNTPPTLILSGWEDKLIHAQVLQQYKASLLQAGVPCKLILYKGAGHGFFNRAPYLNQTTEAMEQFLESRGYISPMQSDSESKTASRAEQ